VDDCVAAARERAQLTGAVFVHPFDDPHVIVGQSTLGLELLDQVGTSPPLSSRSAAAA